MADELLVDTGLLRAAAAIADDAARLFAGAGGRDEGCRLTDDSLGTSPAAREVVHSASRRVREALEVARRMADASTQTAARMGDVAASFERMESMIGRPPR